MTSAFSSVLLAAGQSTRMGRDKALLEHEGAPLWRRQRVVLAAAGATEIFLSVRTDQAWADRAEGFTGVLHDALFSCGPLVGVTAALEHTALPWVAALAIDLPAITPEWFAGLWAGCAPGVGAVGRRAGFFEPLAAIYPRELRFPAWEAIVRGEFSFQSLLATAVEQGLMRVREITDAEVPLFTNWNEGAFAPPKPTV